MNIVDLIKGQLNDDVIGKLGNVAGLSGEQSRGAVNAAIPTLLSGLAGLSSTRDGATKLSSVLDSQEPGMLSGFANMLGNQGANMAEQGSSMLSSLFGGSMTTAIIGALAKYLGGNIGSITKLLGAIAPMILGVIGSQKKGLGLDAAGLGKMLAEQKNNITSAMPSGLSSALSSVAGLSGLADSAKAGISTAASYGQQAVQQAANPLKWIIPVGLLAIAAFVLWQFFGKPDAGKAITETAKGMMSAADATKFGGDIASSFTSITELLNGVKDVATAETALPKLTEISNKLDGFKGMMDKVPAAAKTGIITMIKDNLKKLMELINRVNEMPVVGEKLKPVLNQIASKLNAMAP